MDNRYSVLMSVYAKERPEYLRAAINSMIGQTLRASEIVLVCDGPLNPELEQVIQEYADYLKLVRLPENRGLGKALSAGLACCQYEWVARMDSDDLAAETRCQSQMAYLQAHPDTDVLSGTLAEFEGESATAKEAVNYVVSYKELPRTNAEIGKYIRYRNPVNHPCVMFRKSKVLEAGGYQPCYLFEDYDLWARMYQKGSIFANLPDTLLYMRVNQMHRRRGGIRYAKAVVHFQTKMYRRKMITLSQYLYITAVRVAVSLMPNCLRVMVYDRKLRKHEAAG